MSQTTVSIGSGMTVLLGGLETKSDAERSQQVVLVSARLLDQSSELKDIAPAAATEEKQIKVFALQNTSAKGAAEVIRELFGDTLDKIHVGVESRTNSLIVSAERKHQLDVVEALLLRLDQRQARYLQDVLQKTLERVLANP